MSTTTSTTDTTPRLECLDSTDLDLACAGDVELREPLSGTGVPYPRCSRHWDRRLDLQDQLRRRYPVHQPSDFDPSYAGESWDGE